MRWILVNLLANLISFGIAFAAALVLLQILARPWRRSAGQHWTERARLAYAPGTALLFLGVFLAAVLGTVGETMIQTLARKPVLGTAGFLVNSIMALAGVLTVRYLWLRELWGSRVTIRSWLAGFLVIGLGIYPGLFATLVLAFAMPDTPNAQAVFIFCAAILAVVFCALGWELHLLAWIGILKTAPAELTAMVHQLAELMKVKGKVRVFVLEWAMVNGLAWHRNRAVGFTRPLLAVMAEKEVRAVAAHELAHLLEPPWVRRIRTAHLFAYLPLVPLAKYGGSIGALAAIFLVMTFVLGYVRFTHRFEQCADRAESDAITDPGAYAMSMTVLHQANCTPAVMPGKQTHPHLYDRLLAGGIQPDFPRPRPPSRAKPMLAVLLTVFAVLLCVLAMFVGIIAGLQVLGYDVRLEAPEQKQE
jgi:Zn-dependent protease with chaperone function